MIMLVISNHTVFLVQFGIELKTVRLPLLICARLFHTFHVSTFILSATMIKFNRCVQDILPNFNLLRTTEHMFF